MNVKNFLISIIAETLFAGLITVLSDAVTLQYAIINGAFLAGLIFALLGVFLHGVNMDWFAYLHTFFSNPNSAKPIDEMEMDAAQEDRRQNTEHNRPPINGTKELIVAGALFAICAFSASLLV